MSTEFSSPPQLAKPRFLDILSEIRAPFEFMSLGLFVGRLRQAPKGDARVIMLIPGYLSDDHAMRPLGKYLRYLGYRVYYTEMGRNMGQVDPDMLRLGQRLETLSTELNGAKITVVGWSLGGVLAREAARLFPKLVQEVITMGTPIVGGPKYTSVGARFAKLKNIDLNAFELDVHQRNNMGFPQPVTSIYSKSDGIVGWQASIDTYNKQANNVEVTGSHLGLGVNPRVWLLIANILGQKN